MADTKISALPASTTPLAGTEVLPIVQSSVTKQVSVANLTAGRAVATGALTVTGTLSATTTGQVGTTLGVGGATPSTSGSGITFPATLDASSNANTLDDYEEGTWTPSQGSNLTIVGTFSSTGTYTKIGNFVVARGILTGSTSAAFTGGSPAILCANLPFTSAASALGNAVDNNSNQGIVCNPLSTSVYGSSPITATASITFSVSFFV